MRQMHTHILYANTFISNVFHWSISLFPFVYQTKGLQSAYLLPSTPQPDSEEEEEEEEDEVEDVEEVKWDGITTNPFDSGDSYQQ